MEGNRSPVSVVSFDNFVLVKSSVPFSVDDVRAPKYRIPKPPRRRKGEGNDGTDSDDPEESAQKRAAAQAVSPEMMLPLKSAFSDTIGAHVVGVFCLHESTVYELSVTLRPDGEPESATSVSAKTEQGRFGDHPNFLTPVHLQLPDLVPCILSQPTSWMLALEDPNPRTRIMQFERFYYDAIFTLPSTENPGLLMLPNGLKRYCIDLRPPSGAPEAGNAARRSWGHNKKLKKAIRSEKLFIVINRDLRTSLLAAKEYHEREHGGTWITEQLALTMALHAAMLAKARESGDASPLRVKLMAVELWRAETSAPGDECDAAPPSKQTLLACVLGFELGRLFHDFSMFTPRREHASYGTILTKILGDALQRSGHTLWYWGNRVAYFSMFEEHDASPNAEHAGTPEGGEGAAAKKRERRKGYGACELDRREFYEIWLAERDVTENCTDVEQFLAGGNGMVPLRSRGSTE